MWCMPPSRCTGASDNVTGPALDSCGRQRGSNPVSTKDDGAQQQKRMGLTMQALAWPAFRALGVFFFSDLLDRQHNTNQSLQTRYSEKGAREVTLKRNKFGH